MPSQFSSPPARNVLERYSSPPSSHRSASKRGGKRPKTPSSILKKGESATYGSLKKRRPNTTGFNRYSSGHASTTAATHKVFDWYRSRGRGEEGGSPLRENTSSNRRSSPHTDIVKKCSGNRLTWTHDTPTRNRRSERTIRRLTGYEKEGLYGDRPDLNPKDGYFDMGAWMNGGGCQDEEEEEEEDYLVP